MFRALVTSSHMHKFPKKLREARGIRFPRFPEHPTTPILDFKRRFAKTHSSTPSRCGIKNPLRAIRAPRAIRAALHSRKLTFIRLVSGGPSWGFRVGTPKTSCLFFHSFLGAQRSSAVLDLSKSQSRIATISNHDQPHTLSLPHFSRKKLFFSVRSPIDRDHTFHVFRSQSSASQPVA